MVVRAAHAREGAVAPLPSPMVLPGSPVHNSPLSQQTSSPSIARDGIPGFLRHIRARFGMAARFFAGSARRGPARAPRACARPVPGGSRPGTFPWMGSYVPRPLAATPTLAPAAPDVPPRALGLRVPSTRISRPDVVSAVAAVEPPVARPPPPSEGGRVTRSQTRAGIAGLVAPLEHDRPRRAPVSPIQRAKTWWTSLVDSGRVEALYNNDWGAWLTPFRAGTKPSGSRC